MERPKISEGKARIKDLSESHQRSEKKSYLEGLKPSAAETDDQYRVSLATISAPRGQYKTTFDPSKINLQDEYERRILERLAREMPSQHLFPNVDLRQAIWRTHQYLKTASSDDVRATLREIAEEEKEWCGD